VAETRQIGRLTVHFLGDNAAQLAKSFDGSLAVSPSFRDSINETARTQRHIFVGSSLNDLRDQPGFDRAEFNPNSERARNTSAFGKPSGADSYFIVVTNKNHRLIQNNGQTFPGSTDLSLVHEFLHPSQIMRTLSEIGRTEAPDSEARVQMREQKIAAELGRTPGKDFPDVFESGPYGVLLDPAETQPRSTPPSNPALPVDPMKYDAGASPSSMEPMSLRLDSRSAPRLVRLNDSPSAGLPPASAALSDSENPSENRFGSGASSLDGITPRNPNLPASPPEAEEPIGLVSGKPMRFPFAPIFNTEAPSGPTGGPDRSTALDDLIWNFGRSRASPFDAGATMPFGPNRRAPTDSGDGAPALSATPAALAPPISAPPDSQGPLSLNDAYLQYLKRLNAKLSPASATDPSAPAAPLVPSDDANFSGGLLGRLMAVAGIDPQNPDRYATPPQDDELRTFYRDDPVQPWTCNAGAKGSDLDRGLPLLPSETVTARGNFQK